MKTLYEDLRSQNNLFSAWRHVKRSALRSKNTKIRGLASEYEHSHQRHLRRIADQLRHERFEFDDVEGVLKDKKIREAAGKAPRPIAIGTIKNRIVQRAILQMLQPRKIKDESDINSRHLPEEDVRIGKLNLVNTSKYGVGGLMSPYGGVQPAIKLVMQAMADGAIYFYQSDIKAFYTQIPTQDVVDCVFAETGDEKITNLFKCGLKVNLANKDELLSYANIFPSGGIGVAQGSSLSAFAGNVLLYDFDHTLNDMNVTMVRYIDDLVILAKTESELLEAKKYAEDELKKHKFSLYKPSLGSDKAAEGKCNDSFKFLGCTIQPNRCVPSKQSVDKILADVNKSVSVSKREIKRLLDSGKPLDVNLSRSSILYSIGKKIYGWEKSFSFCTDVQEFKILDGKIRKTILDYENWIRNKTKTVSTEILLQVLGVPSTELLFTLDKSKRASEQNSKIS